MDNNPQELAEIFSASKSKQVLYYRIKVFFTYFFFVSAKGFVEGREGCRGGNVCALSVMLTPNHQVSWGLINAPGVTGHAGVGTGVWQVGGADEQAARLQQGEPGQLDRAAGQDTLTCREGVEEIDGVGRRTREEGEVER